MTIVILAGLVFTLTAALVWLARVQGEQAEAERRERESNEASRDANRIKSDVATDPEQRGRVRDEFDNT